MIDFREWECPECGFEMVAIDAAALGIGKRVHLAEHAANRLVLCSEEPDGRTSPRSPGASF